MAQTQNTKPFVRIQSNININVTAGLHHQDVTNPDAHVADRLKVNPQWPKLTCMIRQGVGIYPSEIVEWPSVKSLAADKILTIGEYLDSAEDNAQVEVKKNLQQNMSEVKAAKSLAELAK